MNKSILKSAQQHIQDLYSKDDKHNLLYHNYNHAVTVVDRINEIAAHYELSEQDTIALSLAGWFHDVGHLYSMPPEHEMKSEEIAREWMQQQGVDSAIANEVGQLIGATKMPAEPQNLTQRIIKDADTYNLGTKEFKKTDKLLKEEMRLRNFTTKLAAWNQHTLEMLQGHEFFTDYCKNLLTAGKEKNMARLKSKSEDQNFENTGTNMLLNENGNKNKEASRQNSFIAKGIQTMLRLTSENHMQLSGMADSKANILISVNAIIISLILSVLIRKIEVDTYLMIPTFTFLATSVTTIVLAIIATRPKVTRGQFSRDDVMHGKTNLLFFGNFYKTSLDEYKWGMSMMMRDPNYLYGGLVDDIYYLGVVLGKKYRLLSIAYYIFMIGILISVVGFILAIVLHQPADGAAIQQSNASPF